ncbi:hypothetical protein QLL95_gp0217 [Cotonvirus japonicus]|uniref:EGF-like domain-containing protein n=1 Tax=Cotonvirus japonicus TaxID=2811091 RepID=A0ABM7NRI4_9VIRU|nr:hypothetical protein QLL95_gp0217 [Cotonvirus japonicus]BCS82706.1 hypothetical protein [Cotonvirus japonicus]
MKIIIVWIICLISCIQANHFDLSNIKVIEFNNTSNISELFENAYPNDWFHHFVGDKILSMPNGMCTERWHCSTTTEKYLRTHCNKDLSIKILDQEIGVCKCNYGFDHIDGDCRCWLPSKESLNINTREYTCLKPGMCIKDNDCYGSMESMFMVECKFFGNNSPKIGFCGCANGYQYNVNKKRCHCPSPLKVKHIDGKLTCFYD